MEYLIVILLAIIAYQLYKLTRKKESSNTSVFQNRGYESTKHPAFTRDEWDEAVNAWYDKQSRQSKDSESFYLPGFDVWEPPNYNEVKYDKHKLENLRTMAGLNKNE